MAPIERKPGGSCSTREHREASFGGNNAMRHHPYNRSPPRARQSRFREEDMAETPARSMSSAVRPPSWYPGDDARGWFPPASRPHPVSPRSRGFDDGGFNVTDHGSGGYRHAPNSGPGFTGPSVYGHSRESSAGRPGAFAPPRGLLPSLLPSLEEEAMMERARYRADPDVNDGYVYQESPWHTGSAPSGHITDVGRDLGSMLRGFAGFGGVHAHPNFEVPAQPSGGRYDIPRKPVPGPSTSRFEPLVRQPEAEMFYADPHWPAADGPGLVRRQAIRRPKPSHSMRHREELHRQREELRRRRRSSDRGVPEGTGNAPPRDQSRPPPKKRVRFASFVERFSGGW